VLCSRVSKNNIQWWSQVQSFTCRKHCQAWLHCVRKWDSFCFIAVVAESILMLSNLMQISIQVTLAKLYKTMRTTSVCRDDRRDEIFAYKRFGGVTESRDAAWRALLTCQWYASRTRQAASRDSVTPLQFNTNTGRFLARNALYWITILPVLCEACQLAGNVCGSRDL